MVPFNSLSVFRFFVIFDRFGGKCVDVYFLLLFFRFFVFDFLLPWDLLFLDRVSLGRISIKNQVMRNPI